MGKRKTMSGNSGRKRKIQRRIISSDSSDDEETAMTQHADEGRPRSPSQAALETSPPAARTSSLSPGANKEADDITLDEATLQLLGDAPKAEVDLGKPVHGDIANRLQNILAKGLHKEDRKKLLEEYLVPRNCDLLVAPTLNPEAKAAISEVSVKRDYALKMKQTQIGVAISALANVTHRIINNEGSKQNILKPISDACRLLCDIHYSDTRTRRHFVMTSINTNMKEALGETTRDSYLFGKDVSEKLKSAKSIQRSGESLKQSNQRPTFNKNNFIKSNTNITAKNRLNSKPQHPKTDNKGVGGYDVTRDYRTRPTWRTQPRTNYRAERSPPRAQRPRR